MQRLYLNNYQKIGFMKKSLLISALTFMISFGLYNSADSQMMICGDGILKSQMERNYPGYLDVVQKTFEEARSRAIQPYRGQEIYTIPVVVHIVWKEEEENLHDSIVFNQIKTLNEDFRRMNADADNIRPIFADRVGDPGIEFELVSIERVQTNAEFTPTLTGLPDQVKDSIQGSVAWDTEHYMNIWVCKLQPLEVFGISLGQVLGYAYPPAGLDNWPEGSSAPNPAFDGVVVDYRIFGRNNELTIDLGIGEPVSGYGRTATHEVGHYLGLRHIWGDALFGDGCLEDDGVEDTPNQASSSEWACDTTRNTCIDPIEDLPDMIENYMDYSDERCMNSFTLGQIAIMRAVIEGPRRGLIEEPTSTEEIRTASPKFRLFPNPVISNEVNLAIGGSSHQHLRLQVFDSMGRLIMDRSDLAEMQSIDLANQSRGMYLFRISNRKTGELIGVEKLMIQR